MLFKNSEFFYYFLLLIVFVFFAVFRFKKRKQHIQKYLGSSSHFLRSSISDFKRFLKSVLSFLVVALLILSLARLQGKAEVKELPQKGSAILIMLDISYSMLAEDVKPSRLSFAKQQLSQLIELSGGDQIALGFFAKSAFLISPFTPDLSAVQSYLKALSPDYLSHQGTDFSNLFDLVSTSFKRQKKLEFKALVIASDGEDHSSQTREKVKQLLEEQNIRIFTLSVGTKRGQVIPIRDYKNQLREYKKDKGGNLVITKLNPESLKKIARWGKGGYYHLDYGNSSIRRLREDLNSLKKQSFDKYTASRKKEYYQWFLALAILLVLFELFLTDRKNKVPK